MVIELEILAYFTIIVVDLYQNIKPYILQSKTRLKKWTENNNLVLAYMSIGEAEDYREYYPNMNKKLILELNEEWAGNYTVKYWESEWEKIILKYLDKILAQGFNGVYLDIVDGFHRFDDKKLHAKRMAILVNSIYQSIRYYNNRLKKYKLISTSRVYESATVGSSNVLFGVSKEL